jgi:hypothetical protein
MSLLKLIAKSKIKIRNVRKINDLIASNLIRILGAPISFSPTARLLGMHYFNMQVIKIITFSFLNLTILIQSNFF